MLLNADVGEGLATDSQLFPYLDQANIACGGHAGNQHSMRQTVSACIDHGVIIGAHPSYPDRENFGRVSMDISVPDLSQNLQGQIESLNQVCESLGSTLAYIKPHGALYNDMMARDELFDLVVDLIVKKSCKLSLMIGAALPKRQTEKANQLDVTLIREAFSDRQYLASGQLMPRLNQGAVFSDVEKITEQVARIRNGIVLDEHGRSVSLKADTICIHGDNPASVQAIKLIAQKTKELND